MKMNQLLKSFVTVVFILVLESRQSESFTCYQCASPQLETNWTLTGLQFPSNLAYKKDLFNKGDCANQPNNFNTTSQCKDFCFTLVVTPLAASGEAKASTVPYYVRGCHSDFTNFTYPGDNKVGVDFNGLCESGYITRYTSSGVAVNTPAAYGWCNIDANNQQPCNYLQYLSLQSCAPRTPSQPTVTCYDCVEGSATVPCTSTSKTSNAAYCYTSDIYVNGDHFVTHSVSSINPIFPFAYGDSSATTQPQTSVEKCGAVNLKYPIQSASISVTGQTCYCNTGDDCNSGAGSISLSFVFMLFASTCFIFKQF